MIVKPHWPFGEAEPLGEDVDLRHQRAEIPCRAVIRSADAVASRRVTREVATHFVSHSPESASDLGGALFGGSDDPDAVHHRIGDQRVASHRKAPFLESALSWGCRSAQPSTSSTGT